MELLMFLLLVLLVDLAALKWGADSREGRDRPEWDRRRDPPLTARTR
jgi:hypothetical protein